MIREAMQNACLLVSISTSILYVTHLAYSAKKAASMHSFTHLVWCVLYFHGTWCVTICVCLGITNAPLYAKTDKSDPMGASVAISNAIAGQPTERGASPILYAAASKELDGKFATLI